MSTCEVHWRSSGGRGEFEFVPADSLLDRSILVDFDHLKVRIVSEVQGRNAQGKPRLRKLDPNNREKLHLPQLVMAVAALPEPARSDVHELSFPLENKSYVMDQMDFDIIDDDGIEIVLSPLRVSVLHSRFQVQLDDRLRAIAEDIANVESIRHFNSDLAEAIEAHSNQISRCVNTKDLRRTADTLISLKSELFGQTNAGSATSLIEAEARPEVEAEELSAREGRLLTRVHVYKERDRKFSRQVRDHYRKLNNGQLVCECCDMVPTSVYGLPGESCIEAHHKIPIEELQPDSVTLVSDMAMVCASCHRVIHSRKPCLTVDEVRKLLNR